MEKWQKDHLITNRHQLLDCTICNEELFSLLLSFKVLTKSEVDQIRLKPGRYDQAALLYDTVETRINGFEIMKEALLKVGQTGPHQIFQQGFDLHMDKSETMSQNIQDIKFNFLENDYVVRNYFEPAEIENVIKRLKKHLKRDEYPSFTIKARQSIKLVNETMPKQAHFYIPRSLMRRVGVNPQIFFVDCSDVFVFKGVEGAHLARLLNPNRVAPSTSQLLNISARFIYLVNEEEWEQIYRNAKDPVHLVNCDPITEKYLLEATSAGSKVIYQYLEKEHDQNKSIIIQEDDFVEEMLRSSAAGVCICDVPGMGKTMLLANLAKDLKQRKPDRIVVFIQMSYFLDKVATRERRSAVRPDVPMDTSLAKQVLLEYITPSTLAYCLLVEILNKTNTRLELFLDGFDEVHQQNFLFAKLLLAALVNGLPNIRIYVTSRPHIRHELEASVKAISYDILPFNENNQVDFLRNYWSNSSTDEEKLLEFAKYCIKEVKSSLNEKECEITGVPLQCRLIGEVFKEGALCFAAKGNPERKVDVEDLCQIGKTLAGLYEKYMDLRFKKITAPVNPADLEKSILVIVIEQTMRLTRDVGGTGVCLSEFQEIKEYHIQQALKTLFPESGEIFLGHAELENAEMTDLRFSAGLLQLRFERGSETIEFMHRTFAEYLVAECFAGALFDQLPNAQWNVVIRERMILLFFEKVLKPKYTFNDEFAFNHPIVVYFFNSICVESTLGRCDDLVVSLFKSNISADELYSILCACICGGHTNILEFIGQILSRIGRRKARYRYKSGIIPWFLGERVTKLLSVAAKYSDLPLVIRLFEFLQDYFEIDVDAMCNKESSFECPLISACTKLDFEMVQFFSQKISSKGRKVLENCVKWSMYDTPAKLERRLSIFNLLLNQNENFIEDERHVLINVDCVHVDVIKFLISNGLNPREAVNNRTLVHRAAQYMLEESFHDLCIFLLQDCQAKALFTEKKGEWKSPLPEILSNSKIQMKTLYMIFQALQSDSNDKGQNVEADDIESQSLRFGISKQDLNSKNVLGRSLLVCAAEGKRDISLIKLMIEMGADVMAEDEAGNTFAHYIALFYTCEKYHEIASLLVENNMGSAFLIANKKGETPLHWGSKHLELKPETLKLLSCGSEAQQDVTNQ